MKPKICILGTHHAYQMEAPRKKYLSTLTELISLHTVDLVAEEASGVSSTYALRLVDKFKGKIVPDISWANVDLTGEERTGVPDSNPYGLGTLVDFDFQAVREWTWVIRTLKRMKNSALLICGFAHMLSVAEKFRWVGCDVETHAYFDKQDDERIKNALEDSVSGTV